MSVHVGELTSEVEMTGVAAAPPEPGRAAPPPGWAEHRFTDLAEERERAAARTAGGGFDG